MNAEQHAEAVRLTDEETVKQAIAKSAPFVDSIMRSNPYRLGTWNHRYTGTPMFCAETPQGADIQATHSESRDEAIVGVRWANERHKRIALMSLAQNGPNGVVII